MYGHKTVKTKGNTMPKVSVLMPACNVEKYIRECMDSVVAQTLKDIEIIVVNDGSKDSTPAILDEYAASDSRVRVVHKVNTGYGHSMNVALDLAEGEYIGVIETDDFADPEMFETLYNAAVENDADVVKSNYFDYYTTKPEKCRLVDNVGRVGVTGEVFAPEDHKEIFNVFPSIWSGIYRRQMLEDNHIRFTETPGASYQDTGFAFKVWSSAERVLLMGDAFLHYRRDNDSSSVNNPGKVFCVCDEIDEIESFLDKYPERKAKFEDAKNIRVYRIYKWNLNRLGLEYKYAFLIRMADKLRALDAGNKLHEDMFTEKQWESLTAIMNDPQQYFRDICAKELKGYANVKDVLEDNKKLKKKIKEIRNSESYKIGRKITSVPRAFKKVLSGD